MTEPGRKSTLCLLLLLAIVARSHAAPTRAYEIYEPDGICNHGAYDEFLEAETPAGFTGRGRCYVNHTADECAEACEQTVGCRFFSHTQLSDSLCCFLHKTCEEPNSVGYHPPHTVYHMPAPMRAYEIYEPDGICNHGAYDEFLEAETPAGFTGRGRCNVNHTADECAEACARTVGCEFFSHTQLSDSLCCFLHKTCEEPNSVGYHPPHTVYRWEPTHDVYGEGICNYPTAEFSEDETPEGFNGLGRWSIPHTVDECAEFCEQTAGCEFFSSTQQNVGHVCFLHKTCSSLNTANPYYTAYRMRVVATSTSETITETSTTSSSLQARPDGVRPGDAVEVKCESEDMYHLAAVHNVSSVSIVVAYKLMGSLYFCTPKVWRTVVANEGEVCEPHGGILPAWGGDKCCPSSCGECGTTDCHTKPGGRYSCCTRRIPHHNVCGKDGRVAPCTLVPNLPFEQSRRLRGDVDVEHGERGNVARLLRGFVA